MLIGIPKEIKRQEYRVAITPAGVAEAFGMAWSPVDHFLRELSRA